MNKSQSVSARATALQLSLSIILSVSATLLVVSFEGASSKVVSAELGQVAARGANLSDLVNARKDSPAKELSVADRVRYQHAIEEVYWRHRIWPQENSRPKPRLNDVISQMQVQQMVDGVLRDSELLADRGQTITLEQLQTEMERIAKNTRQPAVLRELFAALNDDPALVAECLVRPVLSKRLLRGFSAPEIGNAKPNVVAARMEGKSNAFFYTLPEIEASSSSCPDDTWNAMSMSDVPSSRVEHSSIWTGTEMIIWGGSSKLANISTRGSVGTGDDIVIAGFILNGGMTTDVILVRGIGPRLAAGGIPNALANPKLELRNSNGAIIGSNDDWQNGPPVSLPPSDPLESAIETTLSPGAYTALLSGVNNGTGVGLVEVYDRGAPAH